MNILQRRPAPPLDRFVDSLWVCHNEPAPRTFERVLPTGAPQLVVNLAEDETRVYREAQHGLICVTGPGSILSGVTSHAQIIDTDEQAYVAGIAFRPGGTVPFIAHPAHELTDADVSLDTVWGHPTTKRVRERLLGARSPAAALDVLERLLWDVWRDRGSHPAVAYALDQFQARPSVARVAAVTASVGLSERRFIERFRSEVGVTPKRYCRLLRFQHVVAAAHTLRDADWADVASSCGYADQAHLIHEFREFSGMTPRAYEHGKTAFQNHVSFLQS
ncbi:MAG: AraC family transcriptional regulator [Vicinamibacterales bacterium]